MEERDFNIELFKVIAPEFASTDPSVLNVLYAETQNQTDIDVWGKRYDLANCLLVAHMLKMAARNGRVGGVTGESVGSLSRSFGGLSNVNDSLDLTSYGAEFKRVRKQTVITPIVINC